MHLCYFWQSQLGTQDHAGDGVRDRAFRGPTEQAVSFLRLSSAPKLPFAVNFKEKAGAGAYLRLLPENWRPEQVWVQLAPKGGPRPDSWSKANVDSIHLGL